MKFVRKAGLGGRLAGAIAVLVLLQPGVASGQELADFDYENLGFRGFSFESGYIFPTRVESTYSFGTRIDLGYLGPGLRIVPGITYWSSKMKRSEVAKLERKVDALIEQQAGVGVAPPVNLGQIDWTDVAVSLDGHFVWAVPFDMLTYLGLGVSAHLVNGDGVAINDTFVEDLLDSVSAGFNLHGGLEWPIHPNFRFYGLSRYELQEDLRYLEFRVGGQFTWGSPAAGEERAR
jgi:hypothetical protein